MFLIDQPALRVHLTGNCRARTPTEYLELMSDEYQAGFTQATIAEGPSVSRFLEATSIPDERWPHAEPTLGFCLCPDSLVMFRPRANGAHR